MGSKGYYCPKNRGGIFVLSAASVTAEVATAFGITKAFAYVVAGFNSRAAAATANDINCFFCAIAADIPAGILRNARIANMVF